VLLLLTVGAAAMSAPYMREDGLYVTEWEDRDKPREVRISDKFETPMLVSSPQDGDRYGLLVTFCDEQVRPKVEIVSAKDFFSNARDVCSKLADLGLHVDRKYTDAFVSYLQEQMQRAPSADSVARPGWVTPEVFALPDTIYGAIQRTPRLLRGR